MSAFPISIGEQLNHWGICILITLLAQSHLLFTILNTYFKLLEILHKKAQAVVQSIFLCHCLVHNVLQSVLLRHQVCNMSAECLLKLFENVKSVRPFRALSNLSYDYCFILTLHGASWHWCSSSLPGIHNWCALSINWTQQVNVEIDCGLNAHSSGGKKTTVGFIKSAYQKRQSALCPLWRTAWNTIQQHLIEHHQNDYDFFNGLN